MPEPDAESSPNPKRNIWKYIGPGLCMAGAAIGVSHIMQSTRAGANYGFHLLVFVLLSNFFKYCAFESGHRYAAATGESLIEAYRKLGRWQLWTFECVTIVTGIGSIAAVSYVTGALAWSTFGQVGDIELWSFAIMGLCLTVLLAGHYSWLNGIIKYIMVLLAVATGVAFVAAALHGPVGDATQGAIPWDWAGFAFIIALMGWMPAPIEVSVFQSLWIQAKDRNDGQHMSWREARIDFNIGYILTVVLAVVFVSLGAWVMYGSGEDFAASNVAFTQQLVALYTTHLGTWIKPVIAFAAFAAMFSTTITVVDGYPRTLAEGMRSLFPTLRLGPRGAHAIWLVLGCTLGGVLIFQFRDNPNSLPTLVDIVTVIAFLTGPFFAGLNHAVVFGKHMPEASKPGKAMWVLSWVSLIFLTVFTVIYIAARWVFQLI
ncbi:MAG: divalent metal cation transporter [Verrucomicrobiota bacterium]